MVTVTADVEIDLNDVVRDLSLNELLDAFLFVNDRQYLFEELGNFAESNELLSVLSIDSIKEFIADKAEFNQSLTDCIEKTDKEEVYNVLVNLINVGKINLELLVGRVIVGRMTGMAEQKTLIDSNYICKPEEWAKIMGVEIIDDDGWRFPNPPFGSSIDTPITRADFLQRARASTVRGQLPDK